MRFSVIQKEYPQPAPFLLTIRTHLITIIGQIIFKLYDKIDKIGVSQSFSRGTDFFGAKSLRFTYLTYLIVWV